MILFPNFFVSLSVFLCLFQFFSHIFIIGADYSETKLSLYHDSCPCLKPRIVYFPWDFVSEYIEEYFDIYFPPRIVSLKSFNITDPYFFPVRVCHSILSPCLHSSLRPVSDDTPLFSCQMSKQQYVHRSLTSKIDNKNVRITMTVGEASSCKCMPVRDTGTTFAHENIVAKWLKILDVEINHL